MDVERWELMYRVRVAVERVSNRPTLWVCQGERNDD